MWASFDGATTWTIKRLIHPGPSAYSSITAYDQGNVYLLFETGRSANLRLVSCPDNRFTYLFYF